MGKTRVLVAWPPQVPSYFNAGHHLQVFLVGAWLRRSTPNVDVTIMDAGALNVNWKSLGDVLYQGRFDVLAAANDFDAIDGLPRLIDYTRTLCPGVSVVTFGRLSSMHPDLFHQFDLDAVVASGDYETGVGAFVEAVASGDTGHLPGCHRRDGAGRWTAGGPGRFLPATEWALPDVLEIPYAAYDALYRDDRDKFCGIPMRRELVAPVARGCPVGCNFCEVHQIFGLRERRLSVDATLRYVEEACGRLDFDYLSFYAPTFTLVAGWVREFCEKFPRRPFAMPWKCATTIRHLDRDLVTTMGDAGCVRISVGLETLEPEGQLGLPRAKHTDEDDFAALAAWCRDAEIELNAFVIAGLPGTDAAAIRRTLRFAESVGARVRPTMFTPYADIAADMTIAEVARFNRQFVHGDHDPTESHALHGHIFGGGSRITTVQDRVPTSAAPASPHGPERAPWGLRPVSAPPFARSGEPGVLNLKSCELQLASFDAELARRLSDLRPSQVRSYPWLDTARQAVASEVGTSPESVLLTPGSDPAIGLIVSALGGQLPGLGLASPLFEPWEHYAEAYGVECRRVVLPLPDNDERDWRPFIDGLDRLPEGVLVALSDPCGFSGLLVPPAVLDEVARVCDRRRLWLVIDACHGATVGVDHARFMDRPRTIVLRSFSKSHGLAGMRVAALLAEPSVARYLSRFRSEAAVSSPAATLLVSLLTDAKAVKASHRELDDVRCRFAARVCSALPTWTALRPGANFVTFVCDSAEQSARVARYLADHRVRVRDVTPLLHRPTLRIGLADRGTMSEVADLVVQRAVS